MKRNEEVMKDFLSRRQSHNTNLTSASRNGSMVLINYETPIAEIDSSANILVLNKCKYSRTTSKIQSQLHNLANQTNYTIITMNEGLYQYMGW